MPRTKSRSIRRSVSRGKHSRKPREEPGSSADVPSVKKISLDESASSVKSKESLSNKKAEWIPLSECQHSLESTCALCCL